MSMYNPKDSGFTLLEVMVALAIFAAMASLLLYTDGNSVRYIRYLDDKASAMELAEYHLNTLLVTKVWPEPGTQEQTYEFARQDWTVQQAVSGTTRARFRRIEVSVYAGMQPDAEPQVPLVSLTTFLREPAS